jgi:hypothetical protein
MSVLAPEPQARRSTLAAIARDGRKGRQQRARMILIGSFCIAAALR